MKRFITLCVAALVAAAGSTMSAQLLYKVEKPGSKKVSYVFGTHHFAPISMIDSVSGLRDALKNSEKLYGEIDMKFMKDPSAIMAMQTSLMAPADSTLDKVLTPVQLDSVATVWKDYTGGAVPLNQFYQLKPAILTTQIAALQAAKALPGLNPMEQLDGTMQDLARKQNKEVGSLETMDFQIGLLYGRPITEQAKGLMKAVRNDKEECDKVIEMTNAYMAQDMKGLEKVIFSENDEESMDAMIFDRNANWAKILIPEMADRQLIVVVGAGHLPGEKGLLKLLKDGGYTVSPVK